MRSTPIVGMIAATVTVAASLSACGDDSEEVSTAEFIEQANARCQETQDDVDQVFEALWVDVGGDVDDPAGQDHVFVAFQEAMEIVVPAMHEMTADLRDLGRPAGDEALLGELFDDLDAAVDEFAAKVDSAAAGDEGARQYLDGQGEAAIDAVNVRAREYGLDVCGAED